MATPVFRSLLVLFALCIAFHHHAMVVDTARSMLASTIRSAQVPRPSGMRGSPGPAGQLSASAVCFQTGGVYYGARATLSVSQLPPVTTNQTSQSSIMMSKSNREGVNIIKAGWHVSPSLYGDTRTRLFTHWTTTNDWSNGCYNSQCVGFIQEESSPIKPGDVLNPADAMAITLYIEQDGDTGDWWLHYQDQKHNYLAIGHWPKGLFTSLAENADSVVFGGEVFFDKDDNGGPPMGSGYLGTETDKAASFTGMQHIDKYGNYDYFSLDDLKFYVDNEACYNTKMTQGPLGVFLFFYGGPRCQSSD